MKKNIVAIDYQISNLFSIKNIFNHLGLEITITSSIQDIRNADALIVPGVGAFGEAMRNLEQFNFIDPIKEFIASGRPLLGICLGMQLLFSQSNEFGCHRGLEVIEGEVVQFPHQIGEKRLSVPKIGWNKISENQSWKNTPLDGLRDNEYVYFLHSYYAKPRNNQWVLTTTQYGGLTYCSSVLKNNIFATQFHPEKSGQVGLEILKNWIKLYGIRG